MDYGKYRYQMKRKAHEAKKHQRSVTVKEVKFRPNTDEHDYEFKKNHIIRFLKQGDKVKANVWFRGREIVHKEIGRALIQRLVEELEEIGAVENRPKMEGNNLVAISRRSRRSSLDMALKLKTHRGARKRFKITANGKIKCGHSRNATS